MVQGAGSALRMGAASVAPGLAVAEERSRTPAAVSVAAVRPRAIAKTICCHQDIAADSCFTLGMLAHVELAREETWRYRHLFWGCGMLGQALYLEAEAAGVRSTGIGCYFDDEMHGLLGIDDERWQSSVSLHGRRSRRRHASRYVAAVLLSALMLPGSRCQRACRRLSVDRPFRNIARADQAGDPCDRHATLRGPPAATEHRLDVETIPLKEKNKRRRGAAT